MSGSSPDGGHGGPPPTGDPSLFRRAAAITLLLLLLGAVLLGNILKGRSGPDGPAVATDEQKIPGAPLAVLPARPRAGVPLPLKPPPQKDRAAPTPAPAAGPEHAAPPADGDAGPEHAAPPADGDAGAILYEEHLVEEKPLRLTRQTMIPGLPVQPDGGGGRFALVIDDLGYNPAVSLAITRLEADITLAVLPGGSHSRAVAELAAKSGRELILHQPMEPHGFPKVNPGPGAMLVSMGPGRLQRVLRDNLTLFPTAIGINNHMGSRLTADGVAMDAVMAVLVEKGLYFIDSRTTDATVALERARAHGVPAAKREIFIDNDQDETAILVQLKRLERLARRRGDIIGIGHPYPETLAALKRWLPGLSRRGVHMVRASRVLWPAAARSRFQPGAPGADSRVASGTGKTVDAGTGATTTSATITSTTTTGANTSTTTTGANTSTTTTGANTSTTTGADAGKPLALKGIRLEQLADPLPLRP